MKVLIVDDERLARVELRQLLSEYEDINIVGEASSADEALKKSVELGPDVVFLDIQMPGKSGFDFLQELDPGPHIIFVTAFDQYALKAFDVSAIDYLLKPIEPHRLRQAVDKVRSEYTGTETEPTLGGADKVFLKDGDQCWFVPVEKIVAVESIGNYSRVYFDENKPMIRRSLNQLEQRLPVDLFFRANRQFLINLNNISDVSTSVGGAVEVTLTSGVTLEMSRRQSLQFRDLKSL
ncbi:response regulator [Gilvimarinus sp. SDUM040013]|uniref:Response regulator n=1 Tax=Gilvimarinus gilvus TaxID=3058038 RepID=A0ABU4RZ35_9GAMM|nr:response regulator [Gilvimarinus sp. SDUM040013]MDO3388621.1 response regulator [Gilvimarinus sp. SDUM040013]MDX6849516.1 response regulator [Gilvimarinus sp. SDUM040013]